MAATYDAMIDAFISENSLDEEIKDSLIELVQRCMVGVVGAMSKEWLGASVSAKSEKSTRTSKNPKLENPADAESIDDLEYCTSAIMNLFCKEKGLKVGGNKKEIKERVWRFIEGNSSDEDKSSRGKAKKEVPKKEIHQCCCLNKQNQPCKVSATEEFGDDWYCFLHIKTAKTTKESSSESESDPEEVPVVVEEKKKPVIKKPKK